MRVSVTERVLRIECGDSSICVTMRGACVRPGCIGITRSRVHYRPVRVPGSFGLVGIPTQMSGPRACLTVTTGAGTTAAGERVPAAVVRA